GFRLCRSESRIEGGGVGVFVSSGKINSGSIVALYPGLIYNPGEPIFLPSIGNQYIFRCEDGTLIDGKDFGLSKILFRLSCSKRDGFDLKFSIDVTWMDKHPINPLAIGQYINNCTLTSDQNVSYQEHTFSEKFPKDLLSFIPNCYYSGQVLPYRLTILLISTRDIFQGEELLSNYHTLIV
ncbi:hypothetical protein HELRODRAFT_77053, partial [Helobdella robusta]|uniref:SET domain-containing protein n=1 Tax=Helobdella robusta TaxID=6412 RepID=T1G2S7_HELRO